MKSSLSTWAMALVVTIVGAFTLYDYKFHEEALSPDQIKIFETKPEHIEFIRIEGENGRIDLVKKNGKWYLDYPIQDLAEETSVETLLETLQKQRGTKFFEGSVSQEKWAEYGLESVKFFIEINRGAEKLEFGGNSFDGKYYLRRQSQLLLGEKSWTYVLNQKVSSLRRRLLFEPFPPVRKIVVQGKDQNQNLQYTLVRGQGGWQFEPRTSWPVDSLKVTHWLNGIDSLMAVDFVAEQITPEVERTFALNPPSLRVQVFDKEGKSWELTVGQDQSLDVYVTTNQRATVYKLAAGTFSTIRVPSEFFRKKSEKSDKN